MGLIILSQEMTSTTIEANMYQISNENRNSQTVMLQLERNQLANLEQVAATL